MLLPGLKEVEALIRKESLSMSYLDKARERRIERSSSMKKAFRQEARRLTHLLINKGYRFKRLYLFGSSLNQRPLGPWSDIDLAIEGLEDELFFKTYALLLKEARFSVDLKPFEDLSRLFRERIKKEGEMIYEAK